MGPCVSRGGDQAAILSAQGGESSSHVKMLKISSAAEILPISKWNVDEIIGPGEDQPSISQSVAQVPSRPAASVPSADKHSEEAGRESSAAKDRKALTTEALAEADEQCSQQVKPEVDNQSLEAHYSVGTDDIGTGTFGVVRKVTHKQTGLRGAVKIVRKDKVKDINQLQQEVMNMWNLDHPNVVKLFDAFDDGQTVSLVMELCTGGELFHAISKARRLCEQDTAIVMDQMLRAVLYLHRLCICHRDLKPENFLFLTNRPINSNVLKLIDFGLSVACSPEEELTEVVGTASYVAPQVLFRKYNNQCDLWSCGIIMYIMLCGHPPFRGRNRRNC